MIGRTDVPVVPHPDPILRSIRRCTYVRDHNHWRPGVQQTIPAQVFYEWARWDVAQRIDPYLPPVFYSGYPAQLARDLGHVDAAELNRARRTVEMEIEIYEWPCEPAPAG